MMQFSEPSLLHRNLAQEIYMSRVISFSPSTSIQEDNSIERHSILGESTSLFSPLADILPQNVHLLTLEPLENNQFLLRLENFYESGEAFGQVVISKGVSGRCFKYIFLDK